MRRLAQRRQGIEERFESSRSAQPPEPLPHAVPVPEFLRKSPPSDIMNHKIVQGLEKLSVVPALVAAPRPRCREHPQYNRPILFRHGREHSRSSKNRLPMSQRKSDLGIPLPYTWLNPSTRPSRVQPGGGPFGPDTCRQGFVWREACGPQDHVCVPPAVRSSASRDNQQAGQ